MRVTTTICALLALMSIPTAASAQAIEAQPLAGLRAFTIAIGDLDEEDEMSCGVTRTGLYTSLRSALNQSDMRITDNVQARDGIIYLSVTLLSSCAAFISLEVKTTVKIEKSNARVVTPVWERGRLRTGFTGKNAGAAIRESVEETAKLLVTDWSSINK